jgi:ribosomal protein L27/CII-binding regulator of phage lambda lysogenization HflD
VRANALNSFQDIGFGYVGNAAQHKPPAVIAYEQTSAAGETKGDLVFGTRGSTSGSTAAVEQVRIRSDGTVDVESVRFTGSQIGISGDPDMIDLGTTAGMVTVNGDLKATGDLTLTKPAAAITHSGGTSLSISSDGSGFVAVESVEFAGANIGISGDTNLMVLTSGVLTVDGKVASTTLETSGAATVATTLDVGGATNLTNTLDVSGATTLGSTVELLANAATVTHSGTTSLTISSTLGYVGVETVRFTGSQIGISGDPDMIDLGTTAGMVTVNGDLKATGDLTLTKPAAAITHSGGTSLSISSDGSGFVAVESVEFAGANIGISGDTNLMVLTSGVLTVDGKVASTTLETSGAATVATTLDVGGATNLTNTLDVSGATTLGSTVELLANAATVTHSGTTSLTISSTLGYVGVETVQFTGSQIGISGDPDMIDLGTTAGMVTVNGDLKATGDLTLTKPAAAITHSGGTSLSISSDGSGFVAVESVEFAGANIGISGDTNLMVLTSGVLTVDGKVASTTLETSGAATVATTLDVGGATNLTNTLDVSGATTLGSTVELLANAATVTHSGTTSLTISSTAGYVGRGVGALYGREDRHQR